MIARENGLEPLIDAILADRAAEPEALAAGFLTDTVKTLKEALDGARDILMERLAENAALLGELRAFMKAEAFITSKVVAGQEEKGAKFSDYFDHREPWANVPSHRALAMLRASKEEVVTLDIAPDPETGSARAAGIIANAIGITGTAPGDRWLRAVADWTWRVKLSITMMIDLLGDLRARAQEEAIAGLRAEPQGPAAGRAGGRAAHAGPRSRHPHRRQGGGDRCHGQAARHRHVLSLPAEERRARVRRPLCCASSPSTGSS